MQPMTTDERKQAYLRQLDFRGPALDAPCAYCATGDTTDTLPWMQVSGHGYLFHATHMNGIVTTHYESQRIMEPKDSTHTGFNMEPNHLINDYKKCPMDSTHTGFDVRNYDEMWRDGDVHCAQCGTYIRSYDAG